MASLEDDQYQRSAAYYKDVQRQYIRATNSIQMDIGRWYQRLADNNDISYAGAKKLLKKNELEEFKWTVEDYIKAGEENAVDQRWMKELENASARHHISYLEAMKLQMQQHAELLSTEFEGGMTDYLHKAYGEQYYRTAFEVAKGTGAGTNLARLDGRKIEAVIKRPWAQDGEDFSSRIWTNKDKLVRNLHTELTQNIIRGESPQKAIDSLSKTMEVSRSQAGRLIMTESAAISSAAQKDCLKELGVEKYEILATLDGQTSEICRDMDGKVFDMKDYKVGITAPPFHPNCRSTTVPYFDDEFSEGEQRAARDGDGKTYYVPADMKYWEWENLYVPKSEKIGGLGIKRTSEQMEKRCIPLRTEVEKYSPRKSKWSGKVKADNERCEQESCMGIKEWNCDIIVRDDVPDHTLIHELLHSCSVSYYSPAEYVLYGKIEEGSVELLSREIANSMRLPVELTAYDNEVTVLQSLNQGLGLYKTNLEFALNLFAQPLPERLNWLMEKVNAGIMNRADVTVGDMQELMDFLVVLEGGYGS